METAPNGRRHLATSPAAWPHGCATLLYQLTASRLSTIQGRNSIFMRGDNNEFKQFSSGRFGS